MDASALTYSISWETVAVLARLPTRQKAALIWAIVGALTATAFLISYSRIEDFKFGIGPEFLPLLLLNLLPVLAMATLSVITDRFPPDPIVGIAWVIVNTASYAGIAWLVWPGVQKLRARRKKKTDQP